MAELEPPYGIIWNAITSGRVIPFFGAGASLSEERREFNARAPQYLPSGRELAEALASDARFPSSEPADRGDLAKVASFYEDSSRRSDLRNRMRQLLSAAPQCRLLHQLFASVPVPQLLITTNYDTLLECAFHDAHRPYELVVYPTDCKQHANSLLHWQHGVPEPVPIVRSSVLPFRLGETTVVFKIHGTLASDPRWDQFVVTEEDYVEFLARMTRQEAIHPEFYEYFRERSFLFLGYGLRDWNLRVVLRTLRNQLPGNVGAGAIEDDDQRPSSWAIQRSPSPVEDRLWARRGVRIFDVSLDTFARSLAKEAGV